MHCIYIDTFVKLFTLHGIFPELGMHHMFCFAFRFRAFAPRTIEPHFFQCCGAEIIYLRLWLYTWSLILASAPAPAKAIYCRLKLF